MLERVAHIERIDRQVARLLPPVYTAQSVGALIAHSAQLPRTPTKGAHAAIIMPHATYCTGEPDVLTDETGTYPVEWLTHKYTAAQQQTSAFARTQRDFAHAPLFELLALYTPNEPLRLAHFREAGPYQRGDSKQHLYRRAVQLALNL